MDLTKVCRAPIATAVCFRMVLCFSCPQDSEGLLMGSSIVLVMIAFFSFCSLLVSISTCWYCKRTIIADSVIEEDNAAAFR